MLDTVAVETDVLAVVADNTKLTGLEVADIEPLLNFGDQEQVDTPNNFKQMLSSEYVSLAISRRSKGTRAAMIAAVTLLSTSNSLDKNDPMP